MRCLHAALVVVCWPWGHIHAQVNSSMPPSQSDAAVLFKQTFAQRQKSASQVMVLPMWLDGRELGVLKARMRDDGVDVDREALLTLLRPLLKESSLPPMSNPSQAVWMDLDSAQARAWGARYVPQRLVIELDVPMDLRQTESLSLGATQTALRPGVLRPEPWSAIINGRWVLSQQNVPGDASSVGRLYADVAARWLDWVVEGQGIYALTSQNNPTWNRQSTRLIRDWPSDALRLTLGDFTTSSRGSATSLVLGGLGLARQFSLLPALPISSQPGTALTLAQGGTVDVRVNGVLARTLRLDPGVYQLSEIPVFTGANAVELTVVEPGGKSSVRVFDYFFDATLLKSGLTEFELGLGVPAVSAVAGRNYDTGQWLASAWWRRGWSQDVTAGGVWQSRYTPNKQARLLGMDAVWASPVGNFSAWYKLSQHQDFSGQAMSAQWRWNQPVQRDHPAGASLRSFFMVAQATRTRQGFAPISADVPGVAALDVGLRAGLLWANGYSSTLGASRRTSDAPADNASGVTLSLRRRIHRQWSLDGSMAMFRQADQQETVLGVSLTYSGDSSEDKGDPGLFWQASAGYQSRDQRKQWDADLAATTSLLDSDVAWQLNASQADASYGQDTSLRARALTGRSEGILAYRQSRRSTGQSSALDLSLASALVVSAGGGWGWSSPVYDSAVQFKPYQGYEGLKLLVDPQQRRPSLASDAFGTPALTNLSAYVARELQLDLEGMPPGLSLGVDRPVVLPSYRSVVVVPVGSNARTQVTGRLMGTQGQPLGLYAIVLTRQGATEGVDLFTNRRGVFTSSQLVPGVYEVTQAGQSLVLARFEVATDQQGIFDIGVLRAPASAP